MSRLPSLSVAIACYNEVDTIEQVIEESAHAAGRIAESFRVLVVDDGSSDGSDLVLARLRPGREWLEVRRHPKNLGFGGTFGELYAYDVCAYNAIMSGDAQFPPSQLEPMAHALDRADVVIGRRSTRQDPFPRRRNSYIYNAMVSLVAGHRVHDVNSISIARTDLVRRLRLEAVSAFMHAEFYLECFRHGGRIVEVDIEHRPRTHGAAQGAKASVITSTAGELMSYALRKGPTWFVSRGARTATESPRG